MCCPAEQTPFVTGAPHCAGCYRHSFNFTFRPHSASLVGTLGPCSAFPRKCGNNVLRLSRLNTAQFENRVRKIEGFRRRAWTPRRVRASHAQEVFIARQ